MGNRLTEDKYECPSCFEANKSFNNQHNCQDLFVLPPFGLLACSCECNEGIEDEIY